MFARPDVAFTNEAAADLAVFQRERYGVVSKQGSKIAVPWASRRQIGDFDNSPYGKETLA
jgi:hypothetical protein